jgi:formylglycine-generating enzyme required for sulfatase activity
MHWTERFTLLCLGAWSSAGACHGNEEFFEDIVEGETSSTSAGEFTATTSSMDAVSSSTDADNTTSGTSNTTSDAPSMSSANGTSRGSSGASTGINEGDAAECPEDMVRIDTPEVSFCIDAYEATNADVYEVLESSFPEAGLPDFCASTMLADTLTPQTDADDMDHPAWLSFCEAAGYCAVRGKRLCGALGGGPVPYASLDEPEYDAAFDPNVSEWHYACTAGGTQEYPYGDTYDEDACVPGPRRPVGSDPECEGGFPGVFDIVGNSVEWEFSCFSHNPDLNDEQSAACRARGDGASAGYTPDAGGTGLAYGCNFRSEVLFDTYVPASFRVAAARCCRDVGR